MNRLQKKCILASMVLHGLLLLLIVFGAAFFSKKPEPFPNQRINVVPSILVENALSGGGGNPNLARSDDRVKGDTLTPTPKPATPVTPPSKPPENPVRPTPPQPAPVPPPPRVEPKRAEQRVETPKVTPAVKTPAPAAPTTPKLELTPTVRNSATKAKEKAAADERAARVAAQKDADFRRELASKFDKSSGTDLKPGFKDGVKMDVGGPGGKAYANYALFVREIYDNAWQVMPDLANQDFAVTIEVTVSSTGRVLNHRIVNRSGNAGMDRSIQRALDKVKASGLPKFPEGATDSERTFSIEFNLKAKRLLG